MSDGRKNQIKQLAKKSGKGRRGAANLLDKTAANAMRTATPLDRDRTLAELLAALGAESAFTVQIGKVHAQPSTNARVAYENAAALARNPQYGADTGAISMLVSKGEHDLLHHHGAGVEFETQMIRSHETGDSIGFSGRCKKCLRYIYCGNKSGEGVCLCGHSYRVTFDRPAVRHWELPRGWPCMDCGDVDESTPVGPTTKGPWHQVNERQKRCHACHVKLNPPNPEGSSSPPRARSSRSGLSLASKIAGPAAPSIGPFTPLGKAMTVASAVDAIEAPLRRALGPLAGINDSLKPLRGVADAVMPSSIRGLAESPVMSALDRLGLLGATPMTSLSETIGKTPLHAVAELAGLGRPIRSAIEVAAAAGETPRGLAGALLNGLRDDGPLSDDELAGGSGDRSRLPIAERSPENRVMARPIARQPTLPTGVFRQSNPRLAPAVAWRVARRSCRH